MKSYHSRPHFVLGPVKPKSSSLTAWLQLSVAGHLQRHARPDVVWMAIPGGIGHDLPDLMFVIPGRQACFMSFSAPDAPLQPERAALQQRLEAAGAGYAHIRDEAGALQALREWKVLNPIPDPAGRQDHANSPLATSLIAGQDTTSSGQCDALLVEGRGHDLCDEMPSYARLLAVTAIAAHAAGGAQQAARFNITAGGEL